MSNEVSLTLAAAGNDQTLVTSNGKDVFPTIDCCIHKMTGKQLDDSGSYVMSIGNGQLGEIAAGGDGITCPTLQSNLAKQLSNQTPIVCGRPWDDSGVNPTLNQSSSQGTPGLSNQELFAQKANGLVMDARGIDAYNGNVTGDTSMTVSSAATDPHHVPCIIEELAQNANGLGMDGVVCLTPPSDHPQNHRIYGTDGAFPALMSNGGKAGQDQSGVLVMDAKGVDTYNGAVSDVSMAITANAVQSSAHIGGGARCYAPSSYGSRTESEVSGTMSLHEGGIGNDCHLIICYENHAIDSRITESGEISPTLNARIGTGGGNLPLIQNVIGEKE